MDPADFKCRRLDRKIIWSIAEDVRQKYWWESTVPVDMEKIIESRLKLFIQPEHFIRRETDMDAYLTIDRQGIVVDHDMFMDERYLNRLRFSFAHELGHYFLHEYAYKDDLFQSIAEWQSFLMCVSDFDYGNFEWQANEFAGRLLVPRDELVRELEKAVNYVRENNLSEYLKAEPKAVLASISPMISKKFGVSDTVIETRAEREMLWPPEDIKY
jgi:Zn-dependent peptidase ImmA (M78 family)